MVSFKKWLNGWDRRTALLAVLVLAAFLGGYVYAQPPAGVPTQVGVKQLNLEFDPAGFTITTDPSTGRQTIRLIRPIPEVWPTPPRPSEFAGAQCAGAVCNLDWTGGGELRQVDLYRNGVYQTVGRDYTLDSVALAVTFTAGGSVEPWEVVSARLHFR
jgi:hypothetical protein